MHMIPGKTFLLGEYVAMYGGPALLALTQPCFKLDNLKRLHPACPASRLWQDKTGKSCDWGLKNPYQGRGGLGASSAEFLLAYQQLFPGKIDISHLREIFCKYSDNGKGIPPSGYDLIAQTSHGCVIVESNPLQLHSFPWQFNELGFVLVHTGVKLATHEHLKEVNQINWKPFVPFVEKACEAMIDHNIENFLSAITNFSSQLYQQHLVARHTQILMKEWTTKLPILAIKGCGAMGADVVAIFSLREKIEYIVDFLKEKSFLVLATHNDLYLENAKK